MIASLKTWARRLKSNLILLWLCLRQPHMPKLAWLVSLATVAYAFSPIDLIPDFIPVLGFVDDVILLPLGIALALRLIPPAMLAQCRPEAERLAGQKVVFKGRWVMAGAIVLAWAALMGWFISLV
ncbi:YkvA family protein [Pseudomonas sp. PSKL.D1]|uniref:YkvA family protein n=1 Tax=Pseudomonas sp. PSKL.D1 TaxID=3029060 RepID=UPI002381422E|nr:YkvA family protein [Pseudomonas sp. PSKL.D1]WDY59826.1 YkvA family protein [Pseudomonas sp. PSKL.D1]